jgi:hypothetical protein
MKLYHGSVLPVEIPRIIKSEYGRDFGFGFYTTDILEQATRWASRRARILERAGQNSQAIISEYEFDEDVYEKLRIKKFLVPDIDWLDMVCKCRSDTSFTHGYDIVIGKIANDNVGETVSYVVRGIMRKEDAIERLKFEKINNQICFCTESAIAELRYVGCREVDRMAHRLIKATLIPEIIAMIAKDGGISEKNALTKYYKSATALSLDDDSTGLYGQSALFIYSLFLQEQKFNTSWSG